MNVAFLGLPGIPYLQKASNMRIMSFAKSIVHKGNHVIIFNKYPVQKIQERFVDKSYSESIKIVEVFNINPPDNKLLRFVLIILSYPREFLLVIRQNRKRKIDILHLYTGHFIDLFLYFILSRVIKAKVVYQYVEFRSKIKRSGIYHKINGYLCDYYGHIFFDGVICISNFLEHHIQSIAPKTLIIKVPPICDFDLFDSIEVKKDGGYILFCGSAGYFDLIKFIIDSYNISKCNNQGINLQLIINGSVKQIENVRHYTLANANIEIVSNLTYSDLIVHYKSAKALLIPIRDTIQDVARFPNKICEYTASKAVIITVNNGEIPYFFENEINAIIAEDYSIKAFAYKIDWMLDHENCLKSIRENAYNTGKQYFDIQSYVDSLDTFLYQIISK